MMCLKGTDDLPQEQWITSQVLKINYTGSVSVRAHSPPQLH